ncbi:hypothetical protein [Chitinophaga sp. 22620]|uniref:hypothetical protein n=1 Tax=Chitinophaga sp. 22620 TaxID=3453952 RepID=UPI003F86C789
MITFPDRATHCKLKLGVAAVDFETDRFFFVTRESAEIPKDKNLTALQTLTAQLPANIADPVIIALGIDFIEQEGEFRIRSATAGLT